MRIGVLALQGAFAPHADVLSALGHGVRLVRRAADLEDLDGLVLPGGESTTHLVLLERTGLEGPLDAFARSGRPVLCTCAGLVLAARRVEHPAQRSFGWLGVEVARNAWGPQVDSFEAVDDARALPLVLIRAPRIVAVDDDTEVLATLAGEPVLVRTGRVWGATFHPELGGVDTVHRAVFEEVSGDRGAGRPRGRAGCWPGPHRAGDARPR